MKTFPSWVSTVAGILATLLTWITKYIESGSFDWVTFFIGLTFAVIGYLIPGTTKGVALKTTDTTTGFE